MKTTSDQGAIGAHTVLNNLDTIPYVEHRLNARYMWANQLKFQEGGITSKLLAPLPSSTKYNEELNKIEQETYISIITGDQPLDAFDRFVDRWNKGGGEQLTKEANEWYAGLKK
jgi:putative aldouronate transport system substrate-binding protein